MHEPQLNPPIPELDLRSEYAHWFSRVCLDPAQIVGTLEIHPVRLVGEAGEPELLLHEAFETKALEIVEKQQNNVNEVIARNVGKRPVLILEGESVRGQKQNRVITVDVLVEPGTEVVVYVGCVEHGRWDHGKTAPFEAAEMPVETHVRRSIKARLKGDGKPDQVGLWNKVGASLDSSDTSSPSSDYYAKMTKFRDKVRDATKAISNAPDQVGILAVEGGKLVGCDLLGHPQTWSRAAERLSQAYVLGSLHADEEFQGAQPVRSADEWLRTIANAGVSQAETKGMGKRFTLEQDSLVGGGLWHGQRPAHVAAFGLERVPKRG